MLSRSTAILRMRSKHSRTVQCAFKLTYSTVMIVPALSFLYCKIWLIWLRVSASAWLMIRFTTLAGISSMTSTTSSRNISSNTDFSSASLNTEISCSWLSLDISTNTSAAFSFVNRRNTGGITLSGNSSSNKAMSCGISSFKTTFNSR